jgi:archaellum component FlaC
MTINGFKRQYLISLLTAATLFTAPVTFANGPVGEHVNHLSDNIETYSQEVNWLSTKVDEMISRYQQGGVEEAKPDLLVEYWEEVKFHSAIETNYVPVYASIWQGLFGLKGAIEEKASIEEIRKQQRFLEQSLWQALGAVKLAAQYQEKGLTDKVATTQANPGNSLEALEAIKSRLDRVVAKYAEKLSKEAVNIVHDTYLNLFEGVEGELISLDADLVEDLEKDFNVVLPQAIQNGKSIDEVRDIVNTMKGKIDTAHSLLEKSAEERKDVF